jgi:hypothetical protein
LAIEASQAARTAEFTAYGDPLGRVDIFRYLGRLLSSTDNDWPDVQKNIVKARKRWAQISKLLVREGATPRVSGKFYKAIVQAVLLYGAESWVLTDSMYRALEGFHNRVARRISRQMPRYLPDEDRWVYPPIAEALEKSGLHPLSVYITRRRITVGTFAHTRPIYDLCERQERMPGTPSTLKCWWDQSFEPEVVIDNPT